MNEEHQSSRSAVIAAYIAGIVLGGLVSLVLWTGIVWFTVDYIAGVDLELREALGIGLLLLLFRGLNPNQQPQQ